MKKVCITGYRLAGACIVALGALVSPIFANAESLRVVSIDTFDRGSVAEGTASDIGVDLSQGACGDRPNQTAEPFFDTFVGMSVRNPRPEEVTIRRVRFRVRLTAGTRVVTSRPLAPLFGVPIAKNSTQRIVAIFLKADSAKKKLAATSSFLSPDLGIQNFSVILDGKTSSGKKFTLRKQVSMAFADYDRCD
jgi:hypothetical protein